jgi:hypothetical protein
MSLPTCKIWVAACDPKKPLATGFPATLLSGLMKISPHNKWLTEGQAKEI